MIRKAAYCGINGAFAQKAAGKIFPDAELAAYPSFADAYKAAESGECDCAVLPIENSFAGEVGQVMDIIFSGRLYISGIWDMRVRQALLGTADAKTEDISTVISHPQALEQCREYISSHGLAVRTAPSTADAARLVSEMEDRRTAAIAGTENAGLYSLKVLAEEINGQKENATRFAVLTPRPGEGAQFMVMFTVDDTAGSLAKAIKVIGDEGFNMTAIHSRPMGTLPWKYYFYVLIAADADSSVKAKMLGRLSEKCETLKVAGIYDIKKI